ncbi:hypothetical protein [Carboxylicivirga linearis]|uniref:SGNH/GDSL hydrolase family protein n=1 Tax=Carboxylicivirga linearis TaxID=1628157 RepID=A0ABS5JUQ2_9BACT|nr:hypothetical protein [Carboxylicivirga linearis]MBS2098625.1 hypothetical protein [Carboxylicivirga linearis]
MYEELGYKVFNLGSSGQSPIQTEVLLNRYLDKLNPKLIIYEVSPKVFASDGIESATDIIANGELDYYSFDMAINLMHLKILNTLIFRIYSEVFYKKTQIPLSIDEPKRTYIKGGFVQVDLKEYNPLKRIGNWRKKEMNKKQVEAFENIVTMAKNREIKLSLVQVPFTKEEYLQYDNQSFNEFISKYGSYYDFNQIELLTDKKYFRDNLHLNTEGVLVFNKQIIKQFKLADEQIKY